MTYTLAAIQANGAVILRSTYEQTVSGNAGDMLNAIRAKYPAAQHCIPFRTFDGDEVLQFKIERPLFSNMELPTTGMKHEF